LFKGFFERKGLFYSKAMAMNFFKRLFSSEKKETLNQGLEKTRTGLFSKLARIVVGKSTIDDEVLDNLEEVLIGSDVGVATTLKIIDRIQDRVSKDKYMGTAELNNILKEEIAGLLASYEGEESEDVYIPSLSTPYVIMVVGVNGVGKTTTIGKLAYQLQKQGKKVVLGAADTFRAAAIDQLKIWGERAQSTVIAQNMGSDPASVAFDTLQHAVAQRADVVIIDTAGRLHNKVGLMQELSKIKRVMDKIVPNAPHNAFEQAKQFTAATQVNTLAVTKLDGTAKGGVVIGVSHAYQLPVKYIGLGEKAEDLKLFNKYDFIKSIFVS